MEEVIWKDIVGYEKYFKISNAGEIWSKRSSKILKQTKLPSGYLVLNTRLFGRDGGCLSLRVHRLVAKAFLGKPTEYLISEAQKTTYKKVIVNHKDGAKDNNNYKNLEWSSPKLNTQHAITEGLLTFKRGLDHPLSILTEDQIDYIKSNYKSHNREFGARSLARKFGVDKETILRAYNGKRR